MIPTVLAELCIDVSMDNKELSMPASQKIEEELKRTKYRQQYRRVLCSTVYTLITAAAVAVLVATLLMPVLRIYGASMTPTLADGDIVLTVKTSDFESGDIVAFYYNNKILVKRVIATSGDWVDITKDGAVYINGVYLEEPYLTKKALGDCNIEMPYQVPESRVFVMGDHREISVDSRNTAVGCVAEEQIVGKLVFRVWPFEQFGSID